MIREHILYDLNYLKIFLLCFVLWPRVFIINVLNAAEKNVVVMKCSIICQLNSTYFAVVQILYFLGDFRSSSSIGCSEGHVAVLNYNSGFIYFSFLLYRFLPHVFWGSVVWCIYIKLLCLLDRLILLYIMSLFLSRIFLYSSVYFNTYLKGHFCFLKN